MANLEAERPSDSEPTAAAAVYSRMARWMWVWHALTYISLGFALVYTLVQSPRPWQEHAAVIGLALLFGAWYAAYIVIRLEYWLNHVPILLITMAAGWAIWYVLALQDGIFMMLLAGLYPQAFSLPPLRWKIVGALTLAVLTITQQVIAAGAIAPIYLLFILLANAAAIALAFFVFDVISQSEERQRLIDELRTTRDELAAVERQAGVLEERQRLAREIHDTLAQGFTSIIMHLETMDAALPADLAQVRKHLGLARDSARSSLAEARRMVWALQPESLERASLAQAIARFTDRWSRESGIEANQSVTGEAFILPPDYEVTLLRAAQEALTNVSRHAHARAVTLTLSYMDDLVALDIQDDGVGFDQTRMPSHQDGHSGGFGLRSMRERVELLGGTLTIESTEGDGTTVAVALPLSRRRSNDG